jgi:hypothetical protein
MISGKKLGRQLMMVWLLLLTSNSWCDEPDVAALIAKLAKPAPTTVTFTEVRFAAILREPLMVSGQLVYSGPQSLDRQVTEPYQEDTQIRGEAVRMQRPGQPVRSFGLQRAPELRGLLAGLTALLAGDAQSIQKNFTVRASGDEQRWQLELTPADARIRRRLKMIRAQGNGAEPRCFSLINADNSLSVMLLGERIRLENAPLLTREGLERICDMPAQWDGTVPCSVGCKCWPG